MEPPPSFGLYNFIVGENAGGKPGPVGICVALHEGNGAIFVVFSV